MAEPESPAAAPGSLHDDSFEAIVEYSDDAILTKDLEGMITSWNPGAERMYGYSAEEAIGQPISILIPPHHAGEERRILDRIRVGERVDHYETERLTKDGELIVVSLSVSPVRDPSGEVASASVIARDITARRRSRDLATRLQQITAALSTEIAPRETMQVVLDQASAALGAAAGAIGLLDSSGERIEIAGSAGYSEEGISRYQSFGMEEPLPMSAAVRTGEPVWITSGAEMAQRFPAIGSGDSRFASLAVIPLTVGGEIFGAISLSFTEPREFDPEERAFLTAATLQEAYAIDRARLYDAERQTSERLAFLVDASHLLSTSLEPETTMERLAQLAVPRLADWCGIDMVDEEGTIRNVAVAHSDPDKVELARELQQRYPTDPDEPTGAPNVIRTGESELYTEIAEEMLVEGARSEEHLRLIRELGLRSAMVVPLSTRGRVLGAVTFVSSESGRRFDSGDLKLAEDLASRAALAIDNSMLYRREHEAAVTLQRELLPEKLPDLEGIELAAFYDPAGLGLDVGGDWYEVVELAQGGLALTIGDVAGRGVRAATIMGRARAAMRAYVLDGHGADQAVSKLDRMIRGSEPPEMLTLFHVHFEPESGTGSYVRAGHPPAMLKLPSGRVEQLAGPGTPPLGILSDVDYRAHALELEPGSLLLLYTDGLIERRDEDLATSLARLQDALASAPSGAEQALAWLRDEFRADEGPDDVAMLAMAVSNGAASG